MKRNSSLRVLQLICSCCTLQIFSLLIPECLSHSRKFPRLAPELIVNLNPLQVQGRTYSMYFSDWLTSASGLGASPLFISRVRVSSFNSNRLEFSAVTEEQFCFFLSEANSRSAVQLKRISEIKLKIFTHFFRVLYTLAQDVHSLVRIAFSANFSENIFSPQACERTKKKSA